MEFGFGTSLQTEVVFLSVADDLLYHRTNLIDLDRVDDEGFSCIAVFFRCILKAGCSLLDTVVDDVGKADQHRGCHITKREFVHHFFQINFHSILAWSGNNMPFVVDVEIVHSPAADAIELAGVFNAPFSHNSVDIERLFFSFKIQVSSFRFQVWLRRAEGSSYKVQPSTSDLQPIMPDLGKSYRHICQSVPCCSELQFARYVWLWRRKVRDLPVIP